MKSLEPASGYVIESWPPNGHFNLWSFLNMLVFVLFFKSQLFQWPQCFQFLQRHGQFQAGQVTAVSAKLESILLGYRTDVRRCGPCFHKVIWTYVPIRKTGMKAQITNFWMMFYWANPSGFGWSVRFLLTFRVFLSMKLNVLSNVGLFEVIS